MVLVSLIWSNFNVKAKKTQFLSHPEPFKFILNCIFLSLLQGWYIVTYALGIYQLNLFIAFLTPKIDPALEELGESDIGVFLHLL